MEFSFYAGKCRDANGPSYINTNSYSADPFSSETVRPRANMSEKSAVYAKMKESFTLLINLRKAGRDYG